MDGRSLTGEKSEVVLSDQPSVAADAGYVVTQITNILEDRLVVRGRPVVDDDVETALPQQLLALPDELLAVQRQSLVLVRGEVGVLVARIDVAVLRIVTRVLGDDIADVEGDLSCILKSRCHLQY
ncbi:hypothetical protein C493_15008 [Natronolimnohabitans innermongolicus JCM 12255]|uniref:Uncharacterized protein n=1 Tax=Natronolimnohabitans innermongolicus JCM 12255 TaxID=1227499 RepID=L9WUJ7_9EURY|nr:hypothetical protein C493_15008 [Natronolimnohabitans innermongolicus JCM 12255]